MSVSEWVHSLIGCDWGTRISLPGDTGKCMNQARLRVILHGPKDQKHDIKVCDQHAEILGQETDPHTVKTTTGDDQA